MIEVALGRPSCRASVIGAELERTPSKFKGKYSTFVGEQLRRNWLKPMGRAHELQPERFVGKQGTEKNQQNVSVHVNFRTRHFRVEDGFHFLLHSY